MAVYPLIYIDVKIESGEILLVDSFGEDKLLEIHNKFFKNNFKLFWHFLSHIRWQEPACFYEIKLALQSLSSLNKLAWPLFNSDNPTQQIKYARWLPDRQWPQKVSIVLSFTVFFEAQHAGWPRLPEKVST